MRRDLLLAGLALAGVALAPSLAFAKWYGIGGFDRALGVVGGKVRWSNAGEGAFDWGITKTARGYTIQVTGGKWGGWYLSYDPTGKDKAVFLTKGPTAGSYWGIGHVGNPGTTPVWAKAGPLKGWSLDRGAKVGTEDCSEKSTVHGYADLYGKKKKGEKEKKPPKECEYRVILSHTRKTPEFGVYEIAP